MNDLSTAARPLQLPKPNDPCWCGSGQKYKKCHRGEDASARAPVAEAKRVRPGKISPIRSVPDHIPPTDYFRSGKPGPGLTGDPGTRLERMRQACRAAAEVLQEAARELRPGITTDAIDELVHQGYIKRGGFPSTLNYHGFPKALCTSVNEVILHGIPDSRPLEDGDIVNLDITIYLNGMHGDCSATFGVGTIDAESQRLIRVTHECLLKGIEVAKPGVKLNAIGRVIEAHAKSHGFGVVREYCGHGIGELFHRDPSVQHVFDPHDSTVIEEGMFFTIEPMLTMGSPRIANWNDGWTVVTADGRRSAQFEHTVWIGPHGAEPLTLPPGPLPSYA